MSKARKLGSALDIGVALLAGGSAAFVAFAMPEDLFSRLVVLTHLPNVLSAAQPPLGDTARLGFVAAAGLATLAFVWSLMNALDRAPVRQASAKVPEAEEEAPRLRKADAHPDAPARRPLQAGRDLGEPLELEAHAPAEIEIEPESEPEPLPPFLVAQEPESETPAPEPEAQSEAMPEPLAEESGDTITKLMQRFETGLSRKKQALPQHRPEPEATLPAAAPPPVDDRVGHRLRSAIAELQKVSPRGA